jgi:hypothetical protein
MAGLAVVDAGWVAESSAERWYELAVHRGPAEQVAALVARCAVGPVGVADLARLAEVDPASLGAEGRVELIQAFERVKAVVDGLQQVALAAVVEATEAAGLAGECARHEVGAALRLSPQTAWRRTRVAAELVGRLPETVGRLRAGEICYWQACAVAEGVRELPDGAAAAVQDRVLGRAAEQTVAETRRAVARAVAAVDPAGAAGRHERAVRERRIERSPLPEAMEGWFVAVPAHTAAQAWQVLTRRARRRQRRIRRERGLDPGLDALRVDTLVEAILHPGCADPTGGDPAGEGVGDGPGPLTRSGAVPRCRCGGAQTAAVVVDLPTLLGLAERPGELPGYGPVPAAVARELARDRDWVRWLTDPVSGALLDRGGRRYRPGDRLRRFVAAAHGRCGFPGCSQPADRCDTDHRVTFRRGGRTVRVNLGPLCRSHHNAKTHGRWRVRLDEDSGVLTWTSPLGKTYTKSIDPILE